jgi:hypothetical protein
VIFRKTFGELFTTRDFLLFGSRPAVDKALSRLVKRGIIKRLARGVFARDQDQGQYFSDEAIAREKALSYGRQLRACHEIVTGENNLSSLKQKSEYYLIDGQSSSFKIGDRKIVFKQVAKRRMALADSKAGQAISALWHLKRAGVDSTKFLQALATLNSIDKENVWAEMRWMPAWLTEWFRTVWLPIKPLAKYLRPQ